LNLRGISAAEVADILALRKIPFVFVSGYNEAPDQRFRDVSFLTKPIQALDLHRALQDMLVTP
jgi:CheY-like chemotaxis protein